MVRNQRDEAGDSRVDFAWTNFTSDASLDCNTATLGVTSDGLATMGKQLIALGILQGTVTA